MKVNRVVLKNGSAEVRIEGTDDRMVEVAFELLNRVSKLPLRTEHSYHGSDNNDDLSKGHSNGSFTASLVNDSVDTEMTVDQMARAVNCDSGQKLALVACEYLHHVESKKHFSRKEIHSAMKEGDSFYKNSYVSHLSEYLKKLVDTGSILKRKQNLYSLSNRTVKSGEKYHANFE